MKSYKGKIVSTKMNKTVLVEVSRRTVHPLYKKVLRRTKKYKADAGELTVNMGDNVVIVETRPISKNKFFKIKEILK